MKFNFATFSMLAYGVTAISIQSVLSNSAIEASDNLEGSGNHSFLAQNFYEDENSRDLSQTYSNNESDSSALEKRDKGEKNVAVSTKVFHNKPKAVINITRVSKSKLESNLS